MRKIVLPVFAFLFISLTSCKKDNNSSASATINPIGTWYLAISTDGDINNGFKETYDTIDHPCLKNNILTVKGDGTAIETYIGTDTCYLYVSGSTKAWIGDPTQSPINFTWTQVKDSFTIVNSITASKITAYLSKTGNQYRMDFTPPPYPNGTYFNSTNVKYGF